MTTDALKHQATAAHYRDWPGEILRFTADHFLLLPIGGLIALIWANVDSERYFTLAHALRFVVNDIGMALFFALIAQEIIEAVLPGGALHTWRRWTLPLTAASGATAGSAAVYLAYVSGKHELVLWEGWPVAAAIDLAFVYMLVKSIFPRHPAIPFVLLVATCSNIFGVAVVASGHPFVQVQAGGTTLMIAAISVAFIVRIWRVKSFWPYVLVCGPMSWWALYLSGVHPALALVPIVFFVPHTPRSSTLFEDPPRSAHNSPRHIEHVFKYPVHVVLFLFGLVNAGVLISGYGTGTWAVVTATLVGKPLGLLMTTAAAVALGLHLPRGLHWPDLIVVSLATCGGFAFALFFATAIYPLGPVLGELKIGAILSGIGVPLTLIIAWSWGVGRFKPSRGVQYSVAMMPPEFSSLGNLRNPANSP